MEDDLLSRLRVASVVIGNLPEQPGYNGSILTIDDTEAAEVERAIDAGVMEIERLREILGDIKNYAHKTDDVLRWCDDGLKVPNAEFSGRPKAGPLE